MLDKIKRRLVSDEGAMGTVETIILIALAVFGTMVIFKYIMVPIQDSSIGIGETINEMNPKE